MRSYQKLSKGFMKISIIVLIIMMTILTTYHFALKDVFWGSISDSRIAQKSQGFMNASYQSLKGSPHKYQALPCFSFLFNGRKFCFDRSKFFNFQIYSNRKDGNETSLSFYFISDLLHSTINNNPDISDLRYGSGAIKVNLYTTHMGYILFDGESVDESKNLKKSFNQLLLRNERKLVEYTMFKKRPDYEVNDRFWAYVKDGKTISSIHRRDRKGNYFYSFDIRHSIFQTWHVQMYFHSNDYKKYGEYPETKLNELSLEIVSFIENAYQP